MAFGIGLPSVVTAARCAATRKTFSLLALTVALAGCESTTEPPPGEEDPPPVANSIKLLDEHNYTTVSTLTPGEIETASGEDLTIRWDALTRDMQCHDMDPAADIGKVAVIRFQNLTNEEAAAFLTQGELDQNQVSAYAQYDTGETITEANLSDLSVFGSEFDISTEYVASDNFVYMMLWGTGTTPGTGARTMTFLKPVEGGTNTTVVATPGCDENGEGILEFEADLAEPAEARMDYNIVDWRGVTTDGIGNGLAYGSITSILVGFYEGMTPADIEANPFDVETMATELWEIEHGGGKTTDLRSAVNRESGELFTGFEGFPEGTWLLGLLCGGCQNPAPLVLSILNPVPAP